MKQNEPKHLIILSVSDIQVLYGKPYFDQKQREYYFKPSPKASAYIQSLANHTGIYFILQWGYFRARHHFYDLKAIDSHEDLQFIIEKFFKNKCGMSELKLPSRNTNAKIKQKIIDLFQYQEINGVNRKLLFKKSCALARQHNKPKVIFKELLNRGPSQTATKTGNQPSPL